MEAAELVERRQEAKRLEQDLVDAHQQGGAAAAQPKGAQCFDTDTPAEVSGDKQTLGVRSLFIEAKRGSRALRFAPGTLEQVSRYSLPCLRKGKGENVFFYTVVPGKREIESNKAVCECVCMRTSWRKRKG